MSIVNEYAASSCAVLRTPLLPHSDFVDWGAGLSAASAPPESLVAAVTHDLKVARSRLASHASKPEVREAILIASGNLARDIRQWLENPEEPRSSSIERSISRYFARMCTRCTPFGTFAGVTALTLGKSTRVQLAARADYRHKTRLDSAWVAKLLQKAGAQGTLRRALRYRTNSTLYGASGRLRYAEGKNVGDTLQYSLVEVEADEHVQRVLRNAQTFVSASQLVELLVSSGGVETEEAAELIDEMIATQLLEAECVPLVTGEDALVRLQALGRVPEGQELCDLFRNASVTINAIDGLAVGEAVDEYDALMSELGASTGQPATNRSVQVDLYKPAENAVLGSDVTRVILQGIEMMRRVSPVSHTGELADFARRFEERYGKQEVPLLQALDPDTGISFGNPGGAGASPLLAGLDVRERSKQATSVAWRPAHSWLLRRVVELGTRSGQELVLGDDDLRAMEEAEPARLPDAFMAFFRIAAREWGAVRTGDFTVMVGGVGGPSGALAIGRFCHLAPELREQIRCHLTAEAALHPQAVLAEIVHLPGERLGNVVTRPVLRNYEIPLLGASGADEDRQLAPQDLTLSLDGSRIVLRSRRLGVEVLPRLTNAHNHRNGFSVYRFLCALQRQHVDPISWSWGPLSHLPHLPRVRIGQVVISLEQWTLQPSELRAIAGATKGLKSARASERVCSVRAEVFRQAQVLRRKHDLPRFIEVVDGDNVLAVDLDNVLSVDSFAQLVKSRTHALIQESWPAPDQNPVTGPEGRYRHEGIASFTRKSPKPSVAPVAPGARSVARQRAFTPGSPWLYFKLYTGRATADNVLLELAPIIGKVSNSGLARRWHFLRYADPEFHLRLRFECDDATHLLTALRAPLDALVDKQLVRRIQIDTYEREIERYGGDSGIEIAEDLFHHDSTAVLHVIQTLLAEGLGHERWRVGLVGVAKLYADVGFDVDAIRSSVERARGAFSSEFDARPPLRRALGQRYRVQQAEIHSLLQAPSEGQSHPAMEAALAGLANRSGNLAGLPAALARAGLVVPLGALAWSYAHMFVNRLFTHEPRAHEFVIYDLLWRHLSSVKARALTRAAS